jgi:hypothetical protein
MNVPRNGKVPSPHVMYPSISPPVHCPHFPTSYSFGIYCWLLHTYGDAINARQRCIVLTSCRTNQRCIRTAEMSCTPLNLTIYSTAVYHIRAKMTWVLHNYKSSRDSHRTNQRGSWTATMAYIPVKMIIIRPRHFPSYVPTCSITPTHSTSLSVCIDSAQAVSALNHLSLTTQKILPLSSTLYAIFMPRKPSSTSPATENTQQPYRSPESQAGSFPPQTPAPASSQTRPPCQTPQTSPLLQPPIAPPTRRGSARR